MKLLTRTIVFCLLLFVADTVVAQSSGPTPPPPPVCSQSNAGALYTNTGTTPATVYTCSYYNLAWNWVVNPSYGGIVYYPTLPTTCSGALPVFLSGWPNTQMYTCNNGVPTAIGGGGGSLPSGTGIVAVNGGTGALATSAQIAAAATTYIPQANVYYQQSGDTIASIEAECTTACTYVVTSPETFTPTGSHTLAATVHPYFEADGSWTVNGTGFVLTIPSQVSGTLSQHFVAGTGRVALGASNNLVPVEWFGAVGDGSVTAGTGTDDTTAIQNALNALTGGQVLFQGLQYRITAALSITRSQIGIRGTGRGWSPSQGNASILFTTSTTADIVDVSGTSSNLLSDNSFNNFALERSAAPTGTTDAGLSLSFVGGAIVDGTQSFDSHRNYYLHSVPAYGIGYVSNNQSYWGANGFTETSGNFYGYYLDSADGNGEQSARFFNDQAGSSLGTTPVTYGMILTGTAVNDVMTYGFETAGVNYGQVVDFTGTGTFAQASDIHFTKSIHDGFTDSAYLIKNVAAAAAGSVEIAGGWVASVSVTGGNGDFDCESSSGISISHVLIGHATFGGNGAPNGVYANGCSNMSVTGNTFMNQAQAINFNNSSNNAITGNTMSNAGSGIGAAAMYFHSGSSYNAINSNTISGSWTGVGGALVLDSTSNYNTGIPTNSFGSGVATPVSDSGTGNGLGPTKTSTLTATTSVTTPSMYVTNLTSQACIGTDASGKLETGTCSGGIGTVTSFAAPSASWPTWLVPTVTNSTTTPSLAVAASAIPNSALATQTANTVLGALTLTTPSGLPVPSCSATNDALEWTSGTGFSCATISEAVSSVSNSDSTLTVSPTTGAVVASLNLTHANTWTAQQNFTAGIGLGSSPPAVTYGTGAGWTTQEGTAPTAGVPAAGLDAIYADSTTHGYKVSLNNGTFFNSMMNQAPSSVAITGGAIDGTTVGATTPSTVKATIYSTATNCSSSASPAVCGSAAGGSVVVAVSATTVVVDTTAVTANSQIQLTFDSSLGTKLGVTCNTTVAPPTVSARTAGTSFTISTASAPTTNPACYSYVIQN